MDPNQSNDVNQVGTNTQTSPGPNSPGNYLTPQQRMQMGQYANSLMRNQQPVNSMSQGLGNMVNSFMGGQMMNQAYPSSQGSGLLGTLLGGNPPTNGNAPMQLPSANGGNPMNIFQGLFGGGNGSTS